jgi:integrase
MGKKKEKKKIAKLEKKKSFLLDLSPVRHIYRMLFGFTLDEVKQMWAEDHYRDLSESGANSYEFSYRYLDDYYDRPFKSLKYRHWQKALNKIKDSGLHYSTQKKFKNLVGQLCSFAIKNEIAEVNFAPMLKLDRNKAVHTKRPFSDKEIYKLWNAVGRISNADLVLMLIYTGLRISEFLRVDMNNDVNVKERFFIVRESKTAAGTNRIVPIHLSIVPFFKKRMKFAKLATGLDRTVYNTYSQIQRAFANVMDALNMKHTIHETRHTCATLLDRFNANFSATQMILGHAGTDITRAVYIHKHTQDLLDAIDCIPIMGKITDMRIEV